MILTLAEFWHRLPVRSLDLFPPALTVSSRTGGGQVIRARSFGEDLWRASVTLAPGYHGRGREIRARLIQAQQPGALIEVSDPSYLGHAQTASLLSRNANNRQMMLEGLPQGFRLAVGDMLSVDYHLHTVTSATEANSLGRSTVQIMPHLSPAVEVGSAVELREPKLLAVVDKISPAMFESVIAGEASFTITQVIQ